jgi:hypothetical protein
MGRPVSNCSLVLRRSKELRHQRLTSDRVPGAKWKTSPVFSALVFSCSTCSYLSCLCGSPAQTLKGPSDPGRGKEEHGSCHFAQVPNNEDKTGSFCGKESSTAPSLRPGRRCDLRAPALPWWVSGTKEGCRGPAYPFSQKIFFQKIERYPARRHVRCPAIRRIELLTE